MCETRPMLNKVIIKKKKKIVIKSFRDMPSALFLQWLLLAMLAAKMRY